MGKLVFLHSTSDLHFIQMMSELAEADAQDNIRLPRPWLDMPRPSNPAIPTLTAKQPVDEQIARAIKEAAAIVYCVGNSGQGPYQENVEAELVRQAVQERAETDNPIAFIPVLLSQASAGDMPEWMRRYAIVNRGQTERLLPRLWQLIKQRLIDPSEPEFEDPPPESESSQLISRLLGPIWERPILTAFIGPYALDTSDSGEIGPAAVTRRLLAQIDIKNPDLASFPPWPSEVAEWLALTGARTEVHQELRKIFSPMGHNPPEIARSIGFLATSWIRKWGERREPKRERDWQGLLLITTRVDLALESALARQANVGFTRILPTLNNAELPQDQRRLVQEWWGDPEWTPNVSPEGADATPSRDVAEPIKGQLLDYSLDNAKRIILVKLCGTLEIPESLCIRGNDFFGNTQHFDQLPRGVTASIVASPHLFLGRGFVGPLAQLTRHKLIERYPTKQPRLLVLPEHDPEAKASRDPLCDLDIALLEMAERNVISALGASDVHRGLEHEFVRKLAERI